MKTFILTLVSFFCSLHANPPLTVTIIIPCHVKHVPQLETLLASYATQTELPDEIVIAASSLNHEAEEMIEKLQSRFWPFELVISTSRQDHLAGKNRNIACALATKELFICQDADDFPHPQRVEIIKFLYTKYQFDHLMHLCIKSEEKVSAEKARQSIGKTYYQLNDLNIHFIERLGDILNPNYILKCQYRPITGVPAFHRRVFEKVQWSETIRIGEDNDFSRKVYNLFKTKILLLEPIYYYRKGHSTHKAV